MLLKTVFLHIQLVKNIGDDLLRRVTVLHRHRHRVGLLRPRRVAQLVDCLHVTSEQRGQGDAEWWLST